MVEHKDLIDDMKTAQHFCKIMLMQLMCQGPMHILNFVVAIAATFQNLCSRPCYADVNSITTSPYK